MPNFQLTLNLKPADLNTIVEARESIIVAKSRPSGRPTAAWLTIEPREKNVVVWDARYALYASGRNGEIVWSTTTPYPSRPGVCYPLADSGAFEEPVTCPVQMAPTDYGVVNRLEASPSLTFGQMESAVLNGIVLSPGPVSADTIPVNQQGVFQPMDTVWVWLQSDLTSGTRLDVGQAISKPAIVTYEGGIASVALVYDAGQGMFVPTT